MRNEIIVQKMATYVRKVLGRGNINQGNCGYRPS